MDPRWYSWPLLPLGWVYGWVMRMRRIAYRKGWLSSYRPEVPVISVGNISMGGTGKTPLCEYLLTSLDASRPAYLSRGYGRKTQGYIPVVPQQHTARQVGDEALQVALKFPNSKIAVCESRKIGITHLIKDHQVGTIVLDDAFQHLKVQRDLDIVVIDANRLPMTDWVLPAGRLRESIFAIRNADLLVVNKVRDAASIPELTDKLARFGKPMAFCCPKATGIKRFDGQVSHWAELAKEPLGAFAGIGNPTFFFSQLQQTLDVPITKRFRDHHDYTHADLEGLTAQSEVEGWITTEKDYIRLLHHPFWQGNLPTHWSYMPIELHWWEGEAEVNAAVKEALRSKSSSA